MRSETSLIIYQSIRCNISEDLRDRLHLWDILEYQFIQNTSNAGTSNLGIFLLYKMGFLFFVSLGELMFAFLLTLAWSWTKWHTVVETKDDTQYQE